MLGKLKKLVLPVAIIGGAIFAVAGLKGMKSAPEEKKAEIPPLVVNTEPAVQHSQTVTVNFQGEVRAKTDIELVTQVTGKVVKVSDKFIEGGEFEPGEVLLQIDDSDYRVALKSAEAAVASAQVDLDMELASAATNAKEWRELQGRPIEEANPLRLNKPQVDRAKARLDAAKAELAAAKLNYDRTKISAPFAGRIMTKSAELGQFMSRGQSVGRVFATDAMEIRIPMTDVQLGELGLKMGFSSSMPGAKPLPAKVSALFGIERRVWNGYLKSVDASVDQKTRLLSATIVVDHPFNKSEESIPLVPGLFVDVELASSDSIAGLQMPRNALRNGTQVYVYDNDKLLQKKVDVLFTSQDFVIVDYTGESELQPNDRVITSSVPGAFDGMPVKINAGDESNVATDSTPEEETPEAELEAQAANANTAEPENTEQESAENEPSSTESVDSTKTSRSNDEAAAVELG